MATIGLRFSNGMLSAAGIGTVVAGMAAIDETVRASLVGLVEGRVPAQTLVRQLSVPVVHAQRLAQTFSDGLGLAGGNHFMLVSFAVAGVVLFVLMFKS
jgi:hypothetical protein